MISHRIFEKVGRKLPHKIHYHGTGHCSVLHYSLILFFNKKSNFQHRYPKYLPPVLLCHNIKLL